MQKGSGYILISVSSQTLAVSPANNDLVDMWYNLWCNNYKSIFFLAGNFFVFDISFISTKNEYFRCALCGSVTTFFSFDIKYTVQNTLLNKQLCPEFINVMIENNMLHKSGAKSTLCNVAMKEFSWSSHVFIHTCPFFSLWHDVRPQLQCVYPYIIINPE